ncbi:GNAT family N-acetyltransferase [Pseudoduganella rivuli]|nr:GNAT family N-acetyltransferase [Pseudoduganella rivuli]
MLIEPSNTTIIYRPITENDLPAAHALSQALRWPHRLEDWQFVLRLGAGFVAEADGTVIGTALCWQQRERHGTVGMIIVSAQHQGKGIGRELMQRVLDQLGERCTHLIATQAGQPLYERLGFQPTGTICQHQGTLTGFPATQLPAGASVRLAEPGDLAAIIALADRGAGMSRGDVLKQLVTVAEGAVLERDGQLAGFALLRRFGRGQVIGPLVAPDTDSAKALIAHWSDACAGAFVRLDVSGDSGLGDWLAQAGLAQVDSGVAMSRNGAPEADPALRQFAIINQALC